MRTSASATLAGVPSGNRGLANHVVFSEASVCASSGLKPWTVGLVKYFEMYMKRTTVYSKLASANLLAAVEKTLSETQGLIQFPGQ